MAAFVSEVPASVRLTGVAVAMDQSAEDAREGPFHKGFLSRKRANRVITPNLAPAQFCPQGAAHETDDRCDRDGGGIA